LQASLTSSLLAKADNGANVPLNDGAQCRIVFCVICFFLLVPAILLHKADILPFCFRVVRCNLSGNSLLQRCARPPNGKAQPPDAPANGRQ
jgi:hypothetical protein